MLGRFLFLSALTLVLPNVLYATDGKDFANFISIERNDQGAVSRIILKKNRQKFTSSELVDRFLKEIKSAQERIGLLEKSLEVQDWPEEHIKKAEEAIAYLKQNDLKPILENPDFKKALTLVFQEADSGAYDFRVLAVPDNMTYFDDHELILKVLRQASELVKLAIGNSYGATIGLFLVQVSFDMILERRNYFQNYLLYHLEKYGPEKFGITPSESRKIKSSIFESRIRWWEFWERSEAQVTWESYGHNKHLDSLVAAKKRKKTEIQDLEVWGRPLGFAFHDGEIGSAKRIVNLLTPHNIVSEKLSHAFDFSKPQKIITGRMLYFLVQLGVRFAPVPAASTVFDFFMDSLYIPQRQMEGSLFGYLRDENSFDYAKQIALQSINPFVIAEVLSK